MNYLRSAAVYAFQQLRVILDPVAVKCAQRMLNLSLPIWKAAWEGFTLPMIAADAPLNEGCDIGWRTSNPGSDVIRR
jgi:hypothetical protein